MTHFVPQARRLVRARVKAVEHLPEWAKCCEPALRSVECVREALGDVFLLDLDDKVFWPHPNCQGCGSPLPELPAFALADGQHKGKYTAVGWLDLDEGPLEPA